MSIDDEHQEDRRVTRRSNDECRRIAQEAKAYFGVGRTWPVNIGRILRSGKVRTLRGEKTLIYRVVDNEVLGTKDAKTEYIDNSVLITTKEVIDSLASWGEGRARMTLAHELGHAVMHATDGAVDHRATGATGPTSVSAASAAESAEHQAKVFASAFLIDDARADELTSPLEIATEFLVSLSAAEICFERIEATSKRAAAAARVADANREYQELMQQSARKTKYLQGVCVACKCQTLLPLATKVGCETCGYVGDHPEDG